MKLSVGTLVHICCDPERREELLGDLEEIRKRRDVKMGKRRAVRRYLMDVLSICLFQSRLRSWDRSQWARAVGVVWIVVFGVYSFASVEANQSRRLTINAHDAAGTFTLEMESGKVVRATLDELPLSADRLMQEDDLLIIKGGDGDRDLLVWITGEQSIRWEGRASPVNERDAVDEETARIQGA